MSSGLFDEPETPVFEEVPPDAPLAERLRPKSLEEFFGHHIGHRSARRHSAAAKSYPFQFQQLIHGSATDRNAANLFYFSACNGLMIGNDCQRLYRRA